MLDLNGQVGQPIKVNDQIFKNKIKKGFYIEAGAYDGQQWSNSLFYEVEKGWDGLLHCKCLQTNDRQTNV